MRWTYLVLVHSKTVGSPPPYQKIEGKNYTKCARVSSKLPGRQTGRHASRQTVWSENNLTIVRLPKSLENEI
jgi:hypothetical protein